MQQVTIDEAIAQLPTLIEAAVRGEEVLITGGGEEVVKLVPVTSARKKRVFGGAKGLFIYLADDFNEPLEEFEEYQ